MTFPRTCKQEHSCVSRFRKMHKTYTQKIKVISNMFWKPKRLNTGQSNDCIEILSFVIRFAAVFKIIPFDWDENKKIILKTRNPMQRIICKSNYCLDTLCRIGFTVYSLYTGWTGQLRLEHKLIHAYFFVVNVMLVAFSSTTIFRETETMAVVNEVLHFLKNHNGGELQNLNRVGQVVRILVRVGCIIGVNTIVVAFVDHKSIALVFPTIGLEHTVLLSTLALIAATLHYYAVAVYAIYVWLQYSSLVSIGGRIDNAVRRTKALGLGHKHWNTISSCDAILRTEIHRFREYMIFQTAYHRMNKNLADVFTTYTLLSATMLTAVGVIKGGPVLEPAVYYGACILFTAIFSIESLLLKLASWISSHSLEFIKLGESIPRRLALGKEWRTLVILNVRVCDLFKFNRNVLVYQNIIITYTCSLLLSINFS